MGLSRDRIAALIPHAGRMVLLDEVVAWDDARIACRTGAHRDRDNPLVVDGQLSSVCAIEFAAQAMAVHGGLLTSQGGTAAPDDGPRAGFLASVRNVRMEVDRLDDVDGALEVHATRESGDEARVLYSFQVCAGKALLVGGRAVVVLLP